MANFWEKDSLVETPAADSKNAFWAKDALVGEKPRATTPSAYQSSILGSFEKGIVGGQQAVKQAQLAGLMDLQAANKTKYGDTYQTAPAEELDKITALDKSIAEKLQSVAQYGVERKEIEAKRGVNPLMRDIRAIGSSDEYKNADTLDQLKMYGDAVWNKKSDIPGYIASIGLEYLPASIPSIAAAMAVKFGGMGPKAAAIAGGAGSTFTEFGNQYAELRAEGLDHKEAWEKAGVKSGVIGLFDAASFRSAGSAASTILKNVEKGAIKATAKETGKQIGTQALYGMAGEAGGSLAIGQKLDPIQIIEEGLGEVVGAPLEAVSTYKQNVAQTNTPGKAVVDKTGQIIDKEVAAKREATAQAQAQQEAGTTTAAPLTGQGDLFTQEQAPYQVTPSERVAQTQAGQTITEPIVDAQVKARQEASDAAQAQIATLQQKLANTTDTNEIAILRDAISKLELQVQQTPGVALDTLKQEYTTLEAKKTELKAAQDQLIAQRDATPTLDGKQVLSEQINALENQGVQISQRQQELLAEGKTTAKELPAKEEAVVEPELNVENAITEDDFKTMGVGHSNQKLRKAILGKKLSDPVQKQEVIDALTAYAQDKNRSASISTRVGEFIDSISKETQNVQRADVSGTLPGGSEPSLRVPSIPSITPTTTQAPVAGGVGSTVGTAGGLDVGEGGVRATGAAPLTQKTANLFPPKPAIDVSQLSEEDRKSIEGFGPRQKRPSTNWFIKKSEEFKKARERGANRIEALFTKGQVYFSFDKAFSDRLYKHFMQLKAQGDVTMDQVKQAMLRISTSQALHRSNLANQIMELGGYTYDDVTNRWEAVPDQVNMRVFEGIIGKLAEKLNVSDVTAMQMLDTAYEANRLNSFYDDLTKAKTEATLTQKKIDDLKRNRKRTKPEQKDLDTKTALVEKLNKRIEDLEGKVRHKTRAQVREGMDLYNRHPEIQLGTRVWNTMRGRTLKMMVDAGMLTEEKAQQWMDEAAYVPFFRDLKEERDASTDVIINRGLKESMTPLRAHMEGSELEVTSPIGNMHKWMQWAIATSISNKQQQVMIDQYAAAIPGEVKEGKGPDSNTFGIYRDGVQRFYTVSDPLIAQGFSHMAPMVFPIIGALRGASNVLRHSVTRIPTFPISQIFMDSYAVMFTSGLKSPFKTLLEIAKETGRTFIGTSETREKLIRKGILETHDYAALNEADAIGERLGFEKPGMWRKTMRALDKFASLADNVVRQGVYNQARKEGQSDLEATERATEIVNFRRMSGMPAIQAASQVIPFYNAYNQVLSVSLRTISGKGIVPQERSAGLKTLASTSAKLGMLSFLYAMMMGDDEDYDKKNKETRDRLWMIPGTGMGIPIRMDFFAIPKVVGEYTYNLLMDKGFSDARHLKNALKRAVLGSIVPPSEGVPQLIRPTIGVAYNYDTFQDRNIVNPTMKRLDPDQRFTKSTAEWAKVMGKMTNISPVNLDYLARGYFGSVATLFSLATDNMIAELRGIPRPEKTLREILARVPSLGAGIGKDENTAVQADFYEVAREADQIINTTKHIAKSNPEEARKYSEEHRDKVAYTQGIANALEGLKRKENAILNSPKMSSAEKAAELKELDVKRNRLMKPVERTREKINK